MVLDTGMGTAAASSAATGSGCITVHDQMQELRGDDTVEGAGKGSKADMEGPSTLLQVSNSKRPRLARDLHKEDSDQEEHAKEAWWICPWCPYEVSWADSYPTCSSKTDARKHRLRKKHLEEEHCDKDFDDPAAALPKRDSGSRMAAIMEARIANVKSFVEMEKTNHTLEYVCGFTIRCGKCGYEGGTKKLPELCSLQRGGLRLNSSAVAAQHMPQDGFCLWHSLAHILGMKFSEIRDRVCEDMEDDGGTAVFNGMTHMEWLHRERGDHVGWASYVDDLRQGREWPGALEIHRVARIFNVNVEVYIAEDMEFKRIMNMNAGSPIKARLEYQNGCHYEPLVDRERRQPLGAVKRDPHVNIVETLNEDERQNFTILLANVSSFNKHRDLVYHYAEERAADCILATETIQYAMWQASPNEGEFCGAT